MCIQSQYLWNPRHCACVNLSVAQNFSSVFAGHDMTWIVCQHQFSLWFGTDQAVSHYLIQCWAIHLPHIRVTSPHYIIKICNNKIIPSSLDLNMVKYPQKARKRLSVTCLLYWTVLERTSLDCITKALQLKLHPWLLNFVMFKVIMVMIQKWRIFSNTMGSWIFDWTFMNGYSTTN